MTIRTAAAAVVAAALVVAGAAAGRLTAPRPALATAPARAAVKPPPSGWPGATRLVDGVPEGYAHTPAGAVAAATNFAVLGGGGLMLDPERERAVVAELAVPEDRVRLVTGVEQGTDQLNNRLQLVTDAARGIPVVLRLVPLTYRLEAYRSQSATVDIWALDLFAADGVLAPVSTWFTLTVVLEWVGGDWKIADLGGHAGPEPGPGASGTETLAMPPELKNFREYRYAAG